MAVLLTGGTGKTSARIARLLQDAKIPFLLTSRRGEATAPPGMHAVKFDWLDSKSFENPFQYKFPNGESISAVYLVAADIAEPAPLLNAFIDYAIKEHGVKRFVVAGGSASELGGPYIGQVWSHLLEIGADYCVMRPSWFMENLIEGGHRLTIQSESKIYTACEDGKIPFVSAADIAAVAFRALTDEKSHNCDHLVLGPELLTYDQIAAKLSKCLGREIVHAKLTPEEQTKKNLSFGMQEHYAKFMVYLETTGANGVEERMNDEVEKVTGRPPQSFENFAQENKAAWE